uniref:Uncharacterized protein n=1 Tax=Caenorhabditis japonica TaxID=281687 RepID=A0A8R1IEF0_CAEJA
MSRSPIEQLVWPGRELISTGLKVSGNEFCSDESKFMLFGSDGISYNWFDTNRVTVMEWPSQSTDLNFIEHLCEKVERCVFGIRAQNADQKFSQLQTAWAQIPQSVLTNLPRICQAVIDSRGFAGYYQSV